MCLAIPMRVVSMEGSYALCQGRSGVERINTQLTGPLPAGQWILSFLGSARELIDQQRAIQVGAALDALERLLGSHDTPDEVERLMQTHFGDLMNREPQLPDFLKP